jgi:ring-1,2-phenylacetyl-CoA epoxidase subunit PaaB
MSSEWPLWEIFIRSQHGLAHKHVGSLHAVDAAMAINNARDVYTRRNEGVSIWRCALPTSSASAPGDKEALFDRNSKVYRHPTFFPMPDEVKHLGNGDARPRALRLPLRLADSPLISRQRPGAWVGKGPMLEEDLRSPTSA